MEQKKTSLFYKILKFLVRTFYPKTKAEGLENLPDGPAIIVGSHAQMNGPIVAELYIPGQHYTWCISQMMHTKEVPAYAYTDFWWNKKPLWNRWFYKILSYIIAPLAACVFNNANTVEVFHDTRSVSTFRKTEELLENGARVVIFPEHNEPHNHILSDFQRPFTIVAKQYYQHNKERLPFVPMYVCPKLKTIYFGKPIWFDPEVSMKVQKDTICNYLMDEITKMAEALPKHTVIPYQNMPKKDYPTNI